MNLRAISAVLGTLVAALAIPASAQRAVQAEDVDAGRALALKLCAACHVVWADQPSALLLGTPGPSFAVIASNPATTRQSLHKFLATTHTTISAPLNMPNPELTEDQIARVVGYILSLRIRR